MGVFDTAGNRRTTIYEANGGIATSAYDIDGNVVYPASIADIPVPSGNLTASSTVALPDLYQTGKGFTCTGLAYDQVNDLFLVGDIGALQPNDATYSRIIKISTDFRTVIDDIELYTMFTGMGAVQGITLDGDGTIWFCSPAEHLIRHIDANGGSIGSLAFSNSPTGIVYSPTDDTLWVLTYGNSDNIIHVGKDGTTLGQYTFSYSEALDQCFLDVARGYMYITAGENYTSRNNVYCFDINTHRQWIPCTVDSYAVEGIWIGMDRMVILNDGYYHSASVNSNIANIYELSQT